MGRRSENQDFLAEEMLTDISMRIRKCQGLEESRQLNGHVKRLDIVALMEAVHNHGTATSEFKQIFDLQVGVMELEPRIDDVVIPEHPRWARHALRVADTEDSAGLISKVSRAALSTAGVIDVENQQEAFFSQRLASILRVHDPENRQKQFKEIFDVEIEYNLVENLEEVVVATAVLGS